MEQNQINAIVLGGLAWVLKSSDQVNHNYAGPPGMFCLETATAIALPQYDDCKWTVLPLMRILHVTVMARGAVSKQILFQGAFAP